MALLGNYFYDGNSFATATVLCTDAALTSFAPNGFYSHGGIVRQQQGGILLAAVSCPSCIYACGDDYVDATAFGQYNLTVDAGTSVGAVIAKFTVANPVGVNPGAAVRATWTYNGITASEYSSPVHGYCQGLIGDENIGGIDNLTGSGTTNYTGTSFVNTGGAFAPSGGVVTWGPYANEAAGGVTLFPGGGFGTTIMVIPKTSSTVTDINFVIDMTNGVFSNGWSLEVECPVSLIAFPTANYSNIDCLNACTPVGPPVLGTYYLGHVSGAAGIPAVNDWMFSDTQGVTTAPDGYYAWLDVVTTTVYCLTVENGVIKSKTPC